MPKLQAGTGGNTHLVSEGSKMVWLETNRDLTRLVRRSSERVGETVSRGDLNGFRLHMLNLRFGDELLAQSNLREAIRGAVSSDMNLQFCLASVPQETIVFDAEGRSFFSSGGGTQWSCPKESG